MVVRPHWRAASAARRWLPWLASGGLLALGAWYALASGVFAPAVPLSWSTGCDMCGVTFTRVPGAADRWHSDSPAPFGGDLLRRAVADETLEAQAAMPVAPPAATAK